MNGRMTQGIDETCVSSILSDALDTLHDPESSMPPSTGTIAAQVFQMRRALAAD